MENTHLRVRDARGGDRFFIDNALLKDGYGAVIGPYGIAVYNALVLHADITDQDCWPSYERIATLTGMSKRQAILKIKDLEDLHIIAKEIREGGEKGNLSNVYTLLHHGEWYALPGAPDAPPLVHDLHPPSESGAPEQDPENKTQYEQSITPNGVIGASANPLPPVFFPELFTTSISDVMATKHTRPQWEAILEAETGRGDQARKGLISKIEQKLSINQHPAIQAYRDVFLRYPPKSVWDMIVETVGANGKLAFWSEVLAEWNLRGYKPSNVKGPLDWFKSGRIPGQFGKGPGTNGGVMTKAEYEAWEAANPQPDPVYPEGFKVPEFDPQD